MTTLAKRSLASIVVQNYKAAQIFERYNLDFCCHGKMSLQEACEKDSLNLDEIMNELDIVFCNEAELYTTLRFYDWDISFLADFIENNHHNYVKSVIPRIHYYTMKIAAKHGELHPELLQIAELFDAISESFSVQLEKEEIILFPYIRRLNDAAKLYKKLPLNFFTKVTEAMSTMETEHEEVSDMLNKIKDLSNNYIPDADACNTWKVAFAELDAFEKDMHQHMHLEINILFPKARGIEDELKNRKYQN